MPSARSNVLPDVEPKLTLDPLEYPLKLSLPPALDEATVIVNSLIKPASPSGASPPIMLLEIKLWLIMLRLIVLILIFLSNNYIV